MESPYPTSATDNICVPQLQSSLPAKKNKVDTLTPDSIASFVSSTKPSGVSTTIQAVKKGLGKFAHGLRFVNTIKNDLPTKDDGQLTSAIKMVGLVSNLLSQIPDSKDGTAMSRISKAFNLKERYNPALLDIINDFNLLSEFKRVDLPKDETDAKTFADHYGKVNLFRHPKVGIIGMRETLSEVSSYILHSPNFTPSCIWELVWEKVNGCVDVQGANTQYKTFRFNGYPVDEGHHFGTAQNRVDEFIEQNRKFISLGFERSYMFLGPPGSGKTTMSQRFARAYSNRILQFSPDVIWNVGDIDIIRLIEESGAEVILIDELDKIMGQLGVHHKGMLLSRIEKMRKCKPGLITIVTANSVKNFPDAMLRPGRIDDIIEFTYPDEGDRKKILQGYANVLDVKVSDDVVDKIAGISEGLTGAWLREVVMQMKVSDPNTACGIIEKMLKYAKARGEE